MWILMLTYAQQPNKIKVQKNKKAARLRHIDKSLAALPPDQCSGAKLAVNQRTAIPTRSWFIEQALGMRRSSIAIAK